MSEARCWAVFTPPLVVPGRSECISLHCGETSPKAQGGSAWEGGLGAEKVEVGGGSGGCGRWV